MAIILSFWVLPALVTIVTPLRYADVMRALRRALITAFAAGSVLIVLPILAAVCRKLTGEGEGPENRGEGNEASSTVDVLIPAAYNIPSLGNMLSVMFVLLPVVYRVGGAESPVRREPAPDRWASTTAAAAPSMRIGSGDR
jgi:Na+/H+-dicarboxylate symporter